MLKRKIENRIESWKATKTNQGLLITGARQTGKTSSIEAFGRERYEAMVKIDFVEQPRAVEVISEAQNLSDLIMRITALAERPLVPESTLLFFDEVQRCADAITWMRYLAEDDRFDVIYLWLDARRRGLRLSIPARRDHRHRGNVPARLRRVLLVPGNRPNALGCRKRMLHRKRARAGLLA